MKTRASVLCLAALAFARPLAAASAVDDFSLLAVQDGGRTKPLDTFARETARRVSGARPFGGESVMGLDPVEWILALLAEPERWQDEVMIRISSNELRTAVALPAARNTFSFRELAGHRPLLDAATRVHDKLGRDERLEPVEQEIATLYDTLALIQGIFSGQALHVVPHGSTPEAAWLSLADLDAMKAPEARVVKERLSALLTAYQAGDRTEVARAASAFRTAVSQLAPGAYPSDADLRREVRYNALKPFRLAWLLYLLGFLVLLAGFPLATRIVSRLGIAVLSAGFAVHSYGMVLRTLVSGRAPVTNMYETVVFAAWGAILLALIFEAVYKAGHFAACAAALAVISLLLADNVPIMDASIQPLVPVLRDNFWLTLHVLTITLGYAAFLLALGIGHLNLGLYFFAPGRPSLLKTLSRFLYRVLQVGTLFLAVGTLLGGVWASYSWGRFWGWDPKETWALIALLGYLALLHGRFAGWIREFGMAVGAILGFLLVLMAWYGVNFILGTGLHSYGFGSGGVLWTLGFAAFEVLVVVAALTRQRSLATEAATPALEAAGASTVS